MSNDDHDPPLEHSSDMATYSQLTIKGARRQKLRAANKKLKRQHTPKKSRRKNWVDDWHNPENWDDIDYDRFEPIMPRDERDRRQQIVQSAFGTAPKTTNGLEDRKPDTSSQTGLVVELAKGSCQVELGKGTIPCRIAGRLNAFESGFTNPVAVGDEVIVSEDGDGGGVIEVVLPRRSMLVRPDVFHSHLQQVVAANVDQLLIVTSWREPVIWPELIDRFLITAERNHLLPIICVNKIDLAADMAKLEQTLHPYRRLGYRLALTSVVTGHGITKLSGLLRERITVLAGLSGVGKSSLLAVVQPGLNLRIGEISEYHGEGRHTTAQATLWRLDGGGAVVDTPGIRQFGLSGLQPSELAAFFPEMAALIPDCRFSDCTHLTEPECAIIAAVETGEFSPQRYKSYRQIYEEML